MLRKTRQSRLCGDHTSLEESGVPCSHDRMISPKYDALHQNVDNCRYRRQGYSNVSSVSWVDRPALLTPNKHGQRRQGSMLALEAL